MRLDHLIYAVADLEAAAQGLRAATGLGVLPGGVHPAWGTRNAIVPLGGAYVELVAVADEARAGESAFGRAVRDGSGLIGFAVEPEDFGAACSRAGVDQQRGARERPDGTLLSWSMAGAEEAIPRGLPFFLRWDDPASNPALAVAPHADVDPVGVAWLAWPTPPEEVDAWLGGAGHGLPIRHGAPAAAVALRDGGEVLIADF